MEQMILANGLTEINLMIGDNVTEYEKRAIDPCWQHKQECLHVPFDLKEHFVLISKRRWNCSPGNIVEKMTEDDKFVDADQLQLDLLGTPLLTREWILKEIL